MGVKQTALLHAGILAELCLVARDVLGAQNSLAFLYSRSMGLRIVAPMIRGQEQTALLLSGAKAARGGIQASVFCSSQPEAGEK